MLFFEFNFISTNWVLSICNTYVSKDTEMCVCVRACVCFLFSLFSFLWKHFILWALRTKLETHETVFAMTLGKDTDENKNSLASMAHLCSDAKCVGHGGEGSLPVVIPLEEGYAVHKQNGSQAENASWQSRWLSTKDIASILDIPIRLQQQPWICPLYSGLFSFEFSSRSNCWVLIVCNTDHSKRKEFASPTPHYLPLFPYPRVFQISSKRSTSMLAALHTSQQTSQATSWFP